MDILLLILLILLGVYSSITDIFSGKIKNWSVYIGIFVGFVINLYSSYNSERIISFIVGFVLISLIGFLLWYSNLWSAADGKLYIAFSLLFPFENISFSTNIYILNIFIISFFFLVFNMLFRLKRSHILKARAIRNGKPVHIGGIFYSILNLFSLFWVISMVFDYFNIGQSLFLKLVLTFLILSKVSTNKSLLFSVPISCIRFIFDKSVQHLDFWLYFLGMVVLYRLFRSAMTGFLFNLSYIMFTKRVSVGKLVPGNVLGDKLVLNGEVFKIEPKGLLDLNNFLHEEAEGLTNKQIQILKQQKIRKIRVARTMPFAPLLFLSAILTLFLKENLLIYVWNLF